MNETKMSKSQTILQINTDGTVCYKLDGKYILEQHTGDRIWLRGLMPLCNKTNWMINNTFLAGNFCRNQTTSPEDSESFRVNKIATKLLSKAHWDYEEKNASIGNDDGGRLSSGSDDDDANWLTDISLSVAYIVRGPAYLWIHKGDMTEEKWNLICKWIKNPQEVLRRPTHEIVLEICESEKHCNPCESNCVIV